MQSTQSEHITIRRAGKADLPEIQRMLCQLRAYHIALRPELCREKPLRLY